MLALGELLMTSPPPEPPGGATPEARPPAPQPPALPAKPEEPERDSFLTILLRALGAIHT